MGSLWQSWDFDFYFNLLNDKLQAYAAVEFADACLRGLRGDANIVECAYVASHVQSLKSTVHNYNCKIFLNPKRWTYGLCLIPHTGDWASLLRIEGASGTMWDRRSVRSWTIERIWEVKAEVLIDLISWTIFDLFVCSYRFSALCFW